MIRWRSVPWVLGVVLVAFSLVAANRLLKPNVPSNGVAPDAAGAVATAETRLEGLRIIGTVDSEPSVVRIDAPAVLGLPALTIEKVHVQEGDTVAIGSPLITFDSSQFAQKKTAAEKELLALQWGLVEAKAAKEDHTQKLRLQALARDTAEKQYNHAKEVHANYIEAFEIILNEAKRALTTLPLSEEEKERRRKNDVDLNKYKALITETKAKFDKEVIEYERLEKVPIDAPVQQLMAGIAALQAKIDDAEATIQSLTLRAKVAGTVEAMAAAAGMTFGATSRTPVLQIVPDGPRVVRAEVEAEFAAKIEERLGKPAVVYDPNRSDVTYAGTVRRMATAYLPKRFGSDNPLGNSTRVRECTIELTEPLTADKPPLLPGQPVHVLFPSRSGQ
jgi:multidrug resistance efflux pump